LKDGVATGFPRSLANVVSDVDRVAPEYGEGCLAVQLFGVIRHARPHQQDLFEAGAQVELFEPTRQALGGSQFVNSNPPFCPAPPALYVR
jgi:hypothetical protein